MLMRYRLRFLLQEIDLSPGSTILGRDPTCGVSLDDDMVSRHHAQIDVSNDVITVKDLGSMNGTRVNGRRISEPTALAHRDRIRLGRDEIVILAFEDGILTEIEAKDTRRMTVCSTCATEFSISAIACPGCGTANVAKST